MSGTNRTLEEYFKAAQESPRPRMITDREVGALLDADAAGNGVERQAGALPQGGRRNLGLLFLALLTGASTMMLMQTKEPERQRVDRSSQPAYRIMIERDSLTGDSSIIMIPANEAVAKRLSEGMASNGLVKFQGEHPVELLPNELARIGARADSDGVWIYYRTELGSVKGLGTTMRGTIFATRPLPTDYGGITIAGRQPAVITDDKGHIRMISYDDKVIDSVLAAKIRRLPIGSNDYIRLRAEIGRKSDAYAMGRMNLLIPVLVRTGHAYTRSDSLKNRWRPDVVLWYEPTPEFLAALPERVGRLLRDDLRSIEADIRTRSVDEPVRPLRRGNTAASSSRLPSPASAPEIDSGRVRSIEPERENEPTTGGRTYLSTKISSGAILGCSIDPNPARDRCMIRCRLSEPRDVTIVLCDIQGGQLREVARIQSGASEWEVELPVVTVPAGIYLIVFTTDGGERMSRRLIVDR